jgi:hypothetical protein
MEKDINFQCGQCKCDEEKRQIALVKIVLMVILLMTIALLLLCPFSDGTFAQDKKPAGTDTLAPIPEIVLVARVVTGSSGQYFAEATDQMTIPKGGHVKVAIVVFGPAGANVEAKRHCRSEVTKTKKNGATTTTSDSVSTDIKPVGKTGVLLSWRQLDPSAGGTCTLTVKVGTAQKSFTANGAE